MNLQPLQQLSQELLRTNLNSASPEALCSMAEGSVRMLMWLETDGQENEWGSHQEWRNKLREIHQALQKVARNSPSTSDCALALKTLLDTSAATLAVTPPDERRECETQADKLVTNHLQRLKAHPGEVHWKTRTALLDLIITLYAYCPDTEEPAFRYLQEQLQTTAQRQPAAPSDHHIADEATAASILLFVRYRNAFLDKTYDTWLSTAIKRHIEAPAATLLSRTEETAHALSLSHNQFDANELRFLCLSHAILSECAFASHLSQTTHQLGQLFLQQSRLTPPNTDLGQQLRTHAILQGTSEQMTAARRSLVCNL